jgi:hypothetical protein
MACMNPFRESWVFVKLNWRIIALCALVAVLVAAAARYDRNRGRFVPIPDNPVLVLDTRTGRYCNPFDTHGRQDIPKCSDLAKGWR